jgi:hypothetical protein
MPSSASQYLEKTVKSRQEYWYEVHEARDEDHELQLIPVDQVPPQYVSAAELADRMADGWELVYDGTTGVLDEADGHDDGESEPRTSGDPAGADARTSTDGGVAVADSADESESGPVRVSCSTCGTSRNVEEDEDPEEVVEDHCSLGCDDAQIEEVEKA